MIYMKKLIFGLLVLLTSCRAVVTDQFIIKEISFGSPKKYEYLVHTINLKYSGYYEYYYYSNNKYELGDTLTLVK